MRRPFDDQETFPEYPMWISFSKPFTSGSVDVYYGTQFEHLNIGLNTLVGNDVHAMTLCRIVNGFHWAGENSIFVITHFDNKDEMEEARDYILINLPVVLIRELLK